MQITFNLSSFGRETIVAIGNALSAEIDRNAVMRNPQPQNIRQQFVACCNELTARSVDHTAYIRCPDHY